VPEGTSGIVRVSSTGRTYGRSLRPVLTGIVCTGLMSVARGTCIEAAVVIVIVYCFRTSNIQGGPKSNPLPNDQKIVLNRSKIRFICQCMNQSSTIILFVGIRYPMHDLLSDLNNYAWPAN